MTSFVILHYKNIQDTLECIASIKKQQNKDYSIIVVDNGTLTKNELKQLKKETSDIICNQENLGFAKGNNLGCSYAIKKYQPDFLVVTNNDIVLQGISFLESVNQCYQQTSFDIMGPKILTNGGESANPFCAYRTLDEVNQAIAKTKKLIRIYQSSLLSFLLSTYFKVKYCFSSPRHMKNGKESMYDVSLHGCFLVFSKKYYEKYRDVFYPETFLYHEEEFLEYRRVHDHLITYYDASICVFHKEGASLNYSFQNQERKKLVFRNQEILKSLLLLQKVMKENKCI